MRPLTPRRRPALVAIPVVVGLVLGAARLHEEALPGPGGAPRLAHAVAFAPRAACGYGVRPGARPPSARRVARATPPARSYTIVPPWASQLLASVTAVRYAVAGGAGAYAPVVLYAARGADAQAP